MSYTNTLRARGGCQGQGLRLFVFFREKERQEGGREALKSFSFLTRQYFMTSAKGGSCWQGARRKWGWRLFDFGFFGWTGAVWAVRLGVATHWHIAGLCHWKIHSFPVYFSRQNSAQQSPFLPPSLPHSLPSSCHHAPFLAATTLCNI